MSEGTQGDVGRGNPGWRRWRLLAFVAVSAVTVGAIAFVIVAKFGPNNLTSHGSVTVRVLSGDSPAARGAWSRSEQRDSPLQWTFVAIAELEWAVAGDRPDRSRCRQDLIILHPRDWQVTAFVDNDLAWGHTASDIEAIRAEHPEIPDPVANSPSAPQLASTVLSQDSLGTRPDNAIGVIWNVPNDQLEDVRVSIVIFCSGRLVSFEWLTNAS